MILVRWSTQGQSGYPNIFSQLQLASTGSKRKSREKKQFVALLSNKLAVQLFSKKIRESTTALQNRAETVRYYNLLNQIFVQNNRNNYSYEQHR